MKWFKRLFVLAILMGLAGLVAAMMIYQHYVHDLPALTGLKEYQPSLVTRVYARDYQLMGEFFVERRQFISRSEVPQDLINAVLAIEDTDFFKHPGIDIVGIMRATVANLLAGRVVQGASTITQQVAKTFLLSSERSFSRKIKEVIISYRIEQHFAKDEILELYLNQIYLGAGAYGVGAASRIYFNRDVRDLTLGQMAVLAGLPKAPSRYDPWRAPEAARQRQALVLRRMVDAGFISDERAKAAVQEEMGLAYPLAPLEQVAPHYLEHVRRTLMAGWGNHQLYHGGMEVFTSLDPALQRAAFTAVQRGLVTFDRRNGYRGPLEHLTVVDETTKAAWLKTASPPTSGPEGSNSKVGHHYGKALVIGLAADQTAHLLLNDGRTGSIGLKGVEWARKQLPDGRLGPTIKKVSDLLKVGDVILVDKHPETGDWLVAQHPDAEAALIALDPHTGQILAMVGGYDFSRSEFNRSTQGRRQPGSSIKPFIYATALTKGYSPVSHLDDSPLEIPYQESARGGVKLWQPQNYDHTFMGEITMRTALEHSRNIPTIRLLMGVGVPYAVGFLNRFGLPVMPTQQNFTMALGTMDFTPLQMASAYGVFANGGKLVQPVYIARVQDRFGRTIHRHSGGDCLLCHGATAETTPTLTPSSLAPVAPVAPVVRTPSPRGETEDPEGSSPMVENQPMFLSGKQVIDPEVAYQTTSLMKGVVDRGTAHAAAKLNRPLAGKTGTTNDLRDAWFIGFSPSLVAAVWVGRDDFTPLGIKETGARAALPIWMDFMAEALKGVPATDFPIPSGIHLEPVDSESGYPADSNSKQAIWEAFKGDEHPRGIGGVEDEIGDKGEGGAEGSHVQEIDGGLY